jgi:hypothetical protein
MRRATANLALCVTLAISGSALSQNVAPANAATSEGVPGSTPAAAASCNLQLLGSVEIAPGEGIRVPVTVGGHTHLFELDFGPNFSDIARDVAVASGLTVERKRMTAGLQVNHKPLKEIAIAESLRLGTVPFGKTEFLVEPPPTAYKEIVGVFNLNFETADIELDLAHRKLNLFAPGKCPGNVVYWTDRFNAVPYQLRRGQPWFEMELEGRKVETAFMPTLKDTVALSHATRELFRFDELSPGIEISSGYDGPDNARTYFRAMQLEAPGLDIRNARVRIRPAEPSVSRLSQLRQPIVTPCRLFQEGTAAYGPNCPDAYPLFLGRNVLKDLRIYIAIREKKIYYSEADATK